MTNEIVTFEPCTTPDAPRDERLNRIERRQRMLAAALLVALGENANDRRKSSNEACALLGIPASPYTDIVARAAANAIRAEWGDELR